LTDAGVEPDEPTSDTPKTRRYSEFQPNPANVPRGTTRPRGFAARTFLISFAPNIVNPCFGIVERAARAASPRERFSPAPRRYRGRFD